MYQPQDYLPDNEIIKQQNKQLGITKQHILQTYQTQNAPTAAKQSGYTTRTIQRWAKQHNLKSGHKPTQTPCPSTAAYKRGCRCQQCKQLYAQQQKQTKKRRTTQYKNGTRKPKKHGASTYTNWDCRCNTCRTEWSKYLRKKRNKTKKQKTNTPPNTQTNQPNTTT